MSKARNNTFFLLLLGIYILNIFDCMATATFLELRLASELNPIMEAVYFCSPWWFFAFKGIIVFACLAAIWQFRHRTSIEVILFVFLTYLTLFVYEASTLFILLWN
jgi:hypothetical protein